jgi:hypothetical protein
MEIVWFIGFWNYNASIAWHEKISIGFWTKETRLFVFGLWFFLLMFCFKDECS